MPQAGPPANDNAVPNQEADAEDAAGQLLQGLSLPLQGGVEDFSDVVSPAGFFLPLPFLADDPL